ncbi:hypothetical protein BCR32DRAFT_250032 [Anaeromyces robustus]|uniref:Uncharacterized protein n=1 Tax=Anaeromyces robustus TaxID=1754192 RepID=A0A1Y1WGD2_9FUNG|nr:hypothetical protein BCR32DRAFT_250032 [Anaeromyces robustus]|eukprot:ORX72532.1 hypothetical protein BCR32DRAFT_250032 [Anaeromyces robustus]
MNNTLNILTYFVLCIHNYNNYSCFNSKRSSSPDYYDKNTCVMGFSKYIKKSNLFNKNENCNCSLIENNKVVFSVYIQIYKNKDNVINQLNNLTLNEKKEDIQNNKLLEKKEESMKNDNILGKKEENMRNDNILEKKEENRRNDNILEKKEENMRNDNILEKKEENMRNDNILEKKEENMRNDNILEKRKKICETIIY